MRIGWFNNWATNYYTDHRYYGEQLYLVLRLRLYITSIVEEPEWIIHKWIYSHVRIHKSYWGYQAQVYYYDGIMYDSWYECISYIDTFARRISGYKQYVYTGKWQHQPRMQNQVIMDLLLILILVRLFTNISNPLVATRNNKNRWHRKLPLLGVAIFNQLANNLGTKNGGKLTRLGLFYNLVNTIIQRKVSVSSHLNKLRGTSLRAIFEGYYRFYNIYYHTKPWLTVHSNLLSLIFTTMHNTSAQVCINYYLIDNKQVTANFLTTYIGWRLRQNYSLTMLLNPIQRELHRVMRVWRRTHKVGRITRNSKVKNIHRAGYINYLSYLFNNYHIMYKQLYLATASWFNYDSLITQYEVAHHICNNKLQEYLTATPQHNSYYGICRIAVSKRAHILFFIKATQSRLYAYYLFTPTFVQKNIADSYLWARATYTDIQCNYVHVAGKELGRVGDKRIRSLPIWPAIRIGAWGLARYHDYTQYITHMGRYYGRFKISKGSIMRSRVRTQSHIRGLLGFKIQLKGRFSRKQIAAKSIKDYGKMPLNTLNAHIDYAFRTVAIKNSAIGIKVWLYRGNYTLTDLYTTRTS